MNACKPLCTAHGLTLATLITRDDLTNFINVANTAIGGYSGIHFCIGLHDGNDEHTTDSIEGQWTWDDGTPCEMVGDRRCIPYATTTSGVSWNHGEPNNSGGEDCFHMWWDSGANSFRANDLDCRGVHHYFYAMCNANNRYSSCEEVWNNGDKQSLIDTSGIYTLTLSDGTTTDQRCIFTYFPSLDRAFAGAMFQSYTLTNGRYTGGVGHEFRCGLGNDGCMTSQDTSNYDSFRWSLARLTGYRNDIISNGETPKYFVSCNGQTSIGGDDYTTVNDHLLMDFFDAFVGTTTFHERCFEVDSVGIRGRGCDDTEAKFWMGGANEFALHIDSRATISGCPGYNSECTYNTGAVGAGGEDNFGHYHYSNPAFQCTATETSNTNFFIGTLVGYC